VDYRNVKTSPADLAQMLVHSRGERRVPVIVEEMAGKKAGQTETRVTIGHGGT
jgi:hypothetical protein